MKTNTAALMAMIALSFVQTPAFADMPFDPSQSVTRRVENVDLNKAQDRERLRRAVDGVAVQTCAGAVAIAQNVRCRRESQRLIESRLTAAQRAAVTRARGQRR